MTNQEKKLLAIEIERAILIALAKVSNADLKEAVAVVRETVEETIESEVAERGLVE